uniref:Sushi, von Willebrand factor type A, EGF and pentraxin domain-containing protein 1-like n=1 Tax=Saccoglossus kowalevskii TaxID=10224 RepID=A0ABM0MLM3_SACKO|nr:PREDICTED: sushi, von Willebrand factor type A, EGF and pentraxin domain-containing protein 1-like [Saccoglossus kowalevskii]
MDDILTVNWGVAGDSLSIVGSRLSISPATEDGLTELELTQFETYQLMLPNGRYEYTFTPIAPGTTYTITVEITDTVGVVSDTIIIVSEDKCDDAGYPCENGGTCWDDGVNYHCSCTASWTGTNCQSPKDPCDPNPCENGGFCIEQPGDYICSCTEGTAGKNCETLVMVRVEESTVREGCLSADIAWELQTVGLMPEKYEVWGYELLFGVSFIRMLCQTNYPLSGSAVTADCHVTGLEQRTTYVYYIDSIHSNEPDPERSDVWTFTTTDTPAFIDCPSDVPVHYCDDGSGQTRVYWEEPRTECAGATAFTSKSHVPGMLFDVGTTLVTYQLIESAAVQDTCAFSVTVQERKMCNGYGDPHLITFENDMYSYQGECEYYLVLSDTSLANPINVTCLTEPWEGNVGASVIREVYVSVYGQVISLMQDHEVRLNGVTRQLPWSFSNGDQKLRVGFVGSNVVVITDFGAEISWDGYHYVKVKLTNEYDSKTRGLCGTIGTDIQYMRDGTEATNVNDFGDSWSVGSDCDPAPPPLDVTCPPPVPCESITDPAGPFANCHSSVPPGPFYSSCDYDYCHTGKHCPSVQAYADRCTEQNVELGDWITETNCNQCEDGKEYRTCGTACQNTCVNPNAERECPVYLNNTCVPGCFCTGGKILDGSDCVDPDDCGCLENGISYSIGDKWHSENCELICECEIRSIWSDEPDVYCLPTGCDEFATCMLLDGTYECICNEPEYAGDGYSCDKTCYSPEVPENGFIVENTTYPVTTGTELTYDCKSGYELYDPSTEQCILYSTTVCDQGNWTEPVPECRAYCTNPGTPQNGYQVGSPSYPVCTGTSIIFNCSYAYELKGEKALTCNDGVWDNDIPICVPQCENPGDPDNGGQIGNHTYPCSNLTEVEFYCDLSYQLMDPVTLECLEEYDTTCVNGNWSQAVPLCLPQCSDPGTPNNGSQTVVHDYPVCSSTVVEYECDEHFILHDEESLECLESFTTTCQLGTWSNNRPICLLECEDPGAPSHGFDTSNNTYPVCSGTDASFTCEQLYELSGPSTTVCHNGEWVPAVPECVPMCINPGNPENGGQVGVPCNPCSESTEIEFYCDSGYHLMAANLTTCLSESSTTCTDGNWTSPLPYCLKECDDPGSPANGKQESTTDFPVCSRTTVSFTCDENYELQGSNVTTCYDGVWSDPVPTCVGQCDDPGTPANGSQVEEHDYPVNNGTWVSFTCDDGYELHDTNTKECVPSYSFMCYEGIWLGDLPVCLGTCSDPGVPENGLAVGNYTFPICSGAVVNYTCDPLFELQGESALTCLNGEWSADIPACVPQCTDPLYPENGYQIGDHDYPVNNGTYVGFACDDGYHLHDSYTRTCLDTAVTQCILGNWTEPLPVCVEECDDPGSPTGGSQIEIYAYPVCSGTKVFFSCDEFHDMQGFNVTVCQAGNWSNPLPQCVPQCYDPGTPINGEKTDEYVFPVSNGTVVNYTCHDGFQLHNSSSSDCMEYSATLCLEGVWTHDVPFCVAECGNPGTPTSGWQVGNTSYPVCSSTTVSFECDYLHELVGSHTIICQNGQWNDSSPNCIPQCTNPGYPEYGGQVGDHVYPVSFGTEVTFYCNDTYHLHDSNSTECLDSAITICINGSWDIELPVCWKECKNPGTPANGEQVSDNIYPVCTGTMVEYVCDDGYDLTGSNSSVCAHGKWSEPLPQCVGNCQDPGTPDNGYQEDNYSYPAENGTVVEFGCNDEYKITCEEGRWNNDLPTCVGNCQDPGTPDNGYQKENYTYPADNGTIVEYGCDEGYTLYNDDTQECVSEAATMCLEGIWSHELPTCQGLCDNPGKPENGWQVGNNTYPKCHGSNVSFACEYLHELIGCSTSTCDDGEWDCSLPECIPQCLNQGSPVNGYQVNEPEYPVSNGTIVVYECNHTFHLHDPDSGVCLDNAGSRCIDGMWTEPVPLCLKECTDPGEPTNGNQLSVHEYPVCSGTTVTFECDDEYDIHGTPENGYQIGPHEYPVTNGTNVEFECNDGYVLFDVSEKECVEEYSTMCFETHWTNPVPKCEQPCNDPGYPENGSQLGEQHYPVCVGTTVGFACDELHALIGFNETMCVNGTWNRETPVCIPQCHDPGSPDNGGQVEDYDYPVLSGTTVSFYCNGTYMLYNASSESCIQESQTTCINGEWSQLVPDCMEGCSDPGTPDNGTQVGIYSYPVCTGTTVTFMCDEDYMISGDETITCDEGQWTNPIPACVSGCDDPGSPDNGGQLEDLQYPVENGTQVSYYCDENYTLIDPTSNECEDEYVTVCLSGYWDKATPQCKMDCDDPGEPKNGRQIYDQDYPCEENFNLVGETTITCVDGNWSHAVPHCSPGCPDPGTPENGLQIDEHVYPVDTGTVVRFCCDSGYDLYGERATMCHHDGSWSDEPPLCLGRCVDPGAPENGYHLVELNYPVKSNTTTSFGCDTGYSLHGPGGSRCENGEWQPAVDDTFCAEIKECCSNPCQNGGTCIDGTDRYDCICPVGYQGVNCESEYSVCYVWGDPHYITYDGVKYEFQGPCSYMLTESVSSTMTSFKVVSINQDWMTALDEKVSVTTELIVIVYGTEVRLMQDKVVEVNGERVALPYQPNLGIDIRITGRYVTLTTDFGMTVRWDGVHFGDVKCPGSYKNTLRGLCGNYNDNPDDDFIDPEDRLIPTTLDHTHRAAMFGNTWVVNGDECTSNAAGCNPCANDIDTAEKAHELCGFLIDDKGPFASCHSTIDPVDFFIACMFDTCSKLPDTRGLCMNGEAYAQVCLDNGIAISWRTEQLCPLMCKEGEEYNVTVSACLKTCQNTYPYHSCQEPRLVDGCTCPYGEVFNYKGECVTGEYCGCLVESRYLPYMESFVREQCDEECTCVHTDRLDCVAVRCHHQAYCGEKDGRHGCHCHDGLGGNGYSCYGSVLI